MTIKDWTPEQVHNAMTYGICPICRAPRHAELTVTENITAYELVCPNGHDQDLAYLTSSDP